MIEPKPHLVITLRFIGRRGRIRYRNLESSFRRKKQEHIRQIASAADKQEHKLRVNEKYAGLAFHKIQTTDRHVTENDWKVR
jgi:hypothetical protein